VNNQYKHKNICCNQACQMQARRRKTHREIVLQNRTLDAWQHFGGRDCSIRGRCIQKSASHRSRQNARCGYTLTVGGSAVAHGNCLSNLAASNPSHPVQRPTLIHSAAHSGVGRPRAPGGTRTAMYVHPVALHVRPPPEPRSHSRRCVLGGSKRGRSRRAPLRRGLGPD
jgi:hypothetical protein